jgi:hypothetical protein
MTQNGNLPDEPTEDPRTERIKDPTGAKMEAWKATLESMTAIAEDREADGWETLEVMTAHTDTVSIDMLDNDEFGLKHIVPGNYADDFEEMYDPDAFTEYLSYGREVEGLMYVVIELIDSDAERSILLACRYDMRLAGGMIESAEQEGSLYSHVKTIDGTTLGVFEYEEWGPLVSPPTGSN